MASGKLLHLSEQIVLNDTRFLQHFPKFVKKNNQK